MARRILVVHRHPWFVEALTSCIGDLLDGNYLPPATIAVTGPCYRRLISNCRQISKSSKHAPNFVVQLAAARILIPIRRAGGRSEWLSTRISATFPVKSKKLGSGFSL